MLEESTVPAAAQYVTIPALPKDAAVTMAYVPFQTDKSRYEDAAALSAGTLFPTLNKPFLRGGCK